MKIVTIIGARPQFIKAAALSRVLRKYNTIQEVLIHTGQHFDDNMSRVFFEEMEIPRPNYNLEIAGLSHGAMTGRMLEKIEQVMLAEKPDIVLVYGDTNSTLAGALAATKLHVPVAHVEAGLRSFNRRMPEEVNRVLTDHVSDLLFAPTGTAAKNLEREGIASDKIHLVGDVMQDAALFYGSKARRPDLPNKYQDLLKRPFALATLHRAENTDSPERLRSILLAPSEISQELPIIMPLHPRTRKMIDEIDIDDNVLADLVLIDPVGYLEMVYLLQKCWLVLTDSGGLQKEAFFFQKPCITLRDETEWVELVEAGVNTLVGADRKSILNAFHEALFRCLDFPTDLYGNGRAGERIVEKLRGGRGSWDRHYL